MTVRPPFKRYPAYEHSGAEWPGEIPSHWDMRQLTRVLMLDFANEAEEIRQAFEPYYETTQQSPDGDFYVRGGPRTDRLPPASAAEYVKTRFRRP